MKIYCFFYGKIQIKTLPRPRKNDDSRNSTLKRSRRHSRPTEWFQEKTESVKETLTRAKETIQRQISTDQFPRAKSPERILPRQVQSQVELRETVRSQFYNKSQIKRNCHMHPFLSPFFNWVQTSGRLCAYRPHTFLGKTGLILKFWI